jgi:hypothetical protein
MGSPRKPSVPIAKFASICVAQTSAENSNVKRVGARYIDIHEGDELDEAQMANWMRQAAALPGFLGPRC